MKVDNMTDRVGLFLDKLTPYILQKSIKVSGSCTHV